MNASSPVDWQSQSVAGLTRLSLDTMPAMELIYLDGLAIHLLGPEAPEAPYTIEHGSAIVSQLLRAVNDAQLANLDHGSDDPDPLLVPARAAVVDGAHRLAGRGGHGVHQLVTRFLAAAVGELERNQEEPEAQVRSLFYYGLLAVASGPENQANLETSESISAVFNDWDQRIGDGFVPPWRIVGEQTSEDQVTMP